MNRRQLVRTSAIISAATLIPATRLFAAQTPEASPQYPEDGPVDTRSRELVDRLTTIRPLALLEALETASVSDPALNAGGNGEPVTSRPWNDPADTDLDHALGGVLIVASDDPINSPDLVMLGAYIVYESADIAFQVLTGMLEEIGDQGSMTIAGTKAWRLTSDALSLSIMRFGYVIVIAGEPDVPANLPEGMVDHLIEVASGMVTD